MLTSKLREQDPILDMDLGVNEAVNDPTGACNYKLATGTVMNTAGVLSVLCRFSVFFFFFFSPQY